MSTDNYLQKRDTLIITLTSLGFEVDSLSVIPTTSADFIAYCKHTNNINQLQNLDAELQAINMVCKEKIIYPQNILLKTNVVNL